MINLRIDGKEVSVAEGTSVLKAAKELGIQIPTMCYLKDEFENHPSCMVCLVKDKQNGALLPSCALPASENMDIVTDDEEVRNARKEALELLLSDHVGDCDAPCRLGCPAYMDIPLMNRLISKGDYRKALEVVKAEIALPHILGYICPAPCEKVCRRTTIDSPVQICQLKKYVAAEDLKSEPYFPVKQSSIGKKVAIIGSGPAGLSASFYLSIQGHNCTIFDKNEEAGGSLRYQKMDKELPAEVLDSEIDYLKSFGVEFKLNTEITLEYWKANLLSKYDAIIIANGISSGEQFNIPDLEFGTKGIQANPDTMETSIPGVFVCGSAIRKLKMAVRSVAQGKAAAYSADLYLKGKLPEKIHRMFNSKFGKLEKEEFEEYLKEANNKSESSIYTALNPYQHEAAKKEADRCLHCDCRKIDHCLLRIHSDAYEVERRKYLLSDRNKVVKHFKQGAIVYEPEKCIKCGICVEITNEKKEAFGFTHIGRGFDVKIKAPFGKSVDEALTSTDIECAKACPTGAISLTNKNNE